MRLRLHELLEQLKDKLNDKEKMILEKRLLTDEPMTLQNIADMFVISRERVRQIEVNLLKKMRKYLEEEMPDIVDFFDGEKIAVNSNSRD
jgi:RNA polymerase sigma-32 factor